MSQNVLFQKAQKDYVNENSKVLTIEEIKKALRPIFEKYRIRSAKLFGSYSKGKATKDSDIDLVVEYDTNTKAFVRMEFMDKELEIINSCLIW